MSENPVLALGLMSGTSLDGIDAALLVTDGDGVVTPAGALTVPYQAGLRERLRACLGRESRDSETDAVEQPSSEDAILADERVVVVDDLLATGGTANAAVNLIRKLGGDLRALAFLIELDFLEGRKLFKDVEMTSVLHY